MEFCGGDRNPMSRLVMGLSRRIAHATGASRSSENLLMIAAAKMHLLLAPPGDGDDNKSTCLSAVETYGDLKS
jgi:hypothetical protein